MEGINKDDLPNFILCLDAIYASNNQFMRTHDIAKLIEEYCKELDCWLPIDENTPKDREILLFYPEQVIFETSMGRQIYAGYYKPEHKDYCRQPTHYKEVPESPRWKRKQN